MFYLDTLTTVLKGINPGVAVLMSVVPHALRPEAVADGVLLAANAPEVMLRPIWAGEGFPADVRRAIDGVASDDSSGLVVTARHLSPGSIRLLTERGLSWADASGYADISLPPHLFITRLKPRPLPQSATTTVSWSRSAGSVAEFVLSRRQEHPVGLAKTWNGVDRIAQIAQATGISPGQVAKILTMFDEEGYTAKFGPERGPTSTRELRDQGRLLSDWAGHYVRSPHKERRIDLHTLHREPHEWEALAHRALGDVPWAMSGWAGADDIAPFVTNVPDMILYVPEDGFDHALERLTEDAEVSPVDRGGRIHLRSAADYVFDFARESKHKNVASPVRVYADLLRIGGRGTDAAEHMREVAIGF